MPKYQRVSEYIKGIGKSLEGLAGQDVLLVSFEYTQRAMRGEQHGFCALRISTDIEKPEKAEDYHAWSDSLGEKLMDIPSNTLPLVAKFERVPTASGFRVWTIT